MEISLPYGKEKRVSIEVPEENFLFAVDRKPAKALENPEQELRKSLKNPIGTPPLKDLVKRGDKVVIVADDNTRPTPQKFILPILLDELNEIGISDSQIEVLIALGTHRYMTEDEILEKFGKEVINRVPVINHDYKNPENLVNIGKTSSGVPVTVNRKVVEADFVIGVGNIVPHPLVGWAGGSKIIQPGVCGEETTAATHMISGRIRPITRIFGKIDNVVRREIDRVALKAGLKFIVNTVLNEKDKISYFAVGHPVHAFKEGVKKAREIFCPKIPAKADIIIASSYPADIEYWQAVKALAFASSAVEHGGSIIFITPCPEGVSVMHPVFREKASLRYGEILKEVRSNKIKDIIGAAGLLEHAQIMEVVGEVICYSTGLTKEDMEKLGFIHVDSIDEALKMALKTQGEKAKIGVLKCGEICPIIESENK